MEIGSEQWISLLKAGAAQAGITLTTGQADQMAHHARALTEWNRRINLTTITDPKEMAVKHFLDAVLPMAHIPEGELLDIGTGGGFPGIPLKVMRPHQPMTLVDASRKKISFVKHVLRGLALPGIEAIQIRVEELNKKAEYQRHFQVIVCRAFADLNQITQMSGPLLADGGKIIVYQGPGEEARRLDHGMPMEMPRPRQALSYRLPFTGDRRTLVILG